MPEVLERLFQRYPELISCHASILESARLMEQSYRSGGKMLLCGNGGSAADCEHMVGELMKGFMSKRPLPEEERQKLIDSYGEQGRYLADHLQGALPAISLVSHTALQTAFANDVAADLVFAQQVYGYGAQGDVLVGFSTSGNSMNVIRALQVAKARGLYTIGFTGSSGGEMNTYCDAIIRVPYQATPDIQERHLPIYHALCIMLEDAFF
ncbi:D-sedoheptulose-7-phosphate isomerase [Paenibacillus cremeus]|uniref:SIS domain-containing protein n=1 Tax=Paenibacillus cremeus TaxID=2163881 RepID=A0A559K7Q7_9BACL|nr:SIS domain-containing protein [Paenibacillus cremeus]TVY08166.1 SIS domain-containing protein [Paenibacillus cremeus]